MSVRGAMVTRATAMVAVLLVLDAPARAQTPSPAPAAAPEPPRFESTVTVVGPTPIHGIGLPTRVIPSNVQVFGASAIRGSAAVDVPGLLADRAASVSVSEAHGGALQPDLLFRGFSGSPLLGASEGVAVYQDGVRVNDPFGDTVNWDVLPSAAIASINLMPGSNPLFGLNALGGALSVRTKDGFDFPGHRVSLRTGSFGRHTIEAETGRRLGPWAYYLTGTLMPEEGWRDHSPSTVRKLFGDLAWRGVSSSLHMSVTAAINDLTGNATAPSVLLDADRSAIFTHADRTHHDTAMTTARARRLLGSNWMLEGVAYLRRSRIETFNGDAADEDDAPPGFDAINNLSDTRGRGVGGTGQLTRTRPLLGRDNHLVVGAGVDSARTDFAFASELAHLTDDRGTIGSGLLDEAQAVSLDSRTTTASVFATNTWSLSKTLALSASSRFNATQVVLRDRIGTALNGRHHFRRLNLGGGLTYQAHPRVNLYGSYSESSRVPTPVELTCADPEDPCRLPNAFVSDPPLEQVVGRTWEGGARGAVNALTWTAAAFSTTAGDDIVFVSSGTLRGEGHFENVPRTLRRGVEAHVEVTRARVSAFAGYTLQRATFETSLRIASPNHPLAAGGDITVTAGARLPGVPAHAGKLGAAVRATGRLTLTTSVHAQSGHHFRGDEANLLPPVAGFATVAAQARHRLTGRLTAVAHVQNLFDVRYSTFGVLGEADILGDASNDPRFYSPGAPRAGWVGLEIAF